MTVSKFLDKKIRKRILFLKSLIKGTVSVILSDSDINDINESDINV